MSLKRDKMPAVNRKALIIRIHNRLMRFVRDESAPTSNGRVGVDQPPKIGAAVDDSALSKPRHFLTLPVEIWQTIMDHLPAEDAVSLSLSCRDVYTSMGNKTNMYGLLFCQTDRKLAFLESLRRDLSPYFMLCEECCLLHWVPQTSGGYGSNKRPRKCNKAEMLERSDQFFHNQFGFGNVQVIAELNRRKEFTRENASALAKYLSALARQNYGYLTKSFVCDFEASIAANGQVYIRKQEWLPLLSTETVNIPDEQYNTIYVCRHLTDSAFRTKHRRDLATAERSISHLKSLKCLPEPVKFSIDSHDCTSSRPQFHINADSSWAHGELWQCSNCATEYRFDWGEVPLAEHVWTSKKSSGPLYAIVVTKWMCLGDGGSSREKGAWRDFRSEKYDRLGHYYQPGSIFSGFEQHTKQCDYRPRFNHGLARLWKNRHRQAQ